MFNYIVFYNSSKKYFFFPIFLVNFNLLLAKPKMVAILAVI